MLNQVIEAENLRYAYPVTWKGHGGGSLKPSMQKPQRRFSSLWGWANLWRYSGITEAGKSTFAKHINVLLKAQEGRAHSDRPLMRPMKNEENLWDIRRHAGMVFQNLDNQIVSTIVEEDVAFGPRTLGYRKRCPGNGSGGASGC